MNTKGIFSCFNPCVITTRSGNLVTVPCGKCNYCRTKRSNYLTDLCNIASNSHKYTVFFTLTYSEDFVPVLALFEGRNSDIYKIVGIDCTERIQKTVNHPKVLPTYGQQILEINNCSFSDAKFKRFFKKSSIKSKLGKEACCKSFPISKYYLRYASPFDFRNFIKRLRFQISSLFDTSFSYFGVSEYGPRTFRPHFHGLLFFNDDELAKHIIDLISKCWKYGTCDSSFATSGQACSLYVSSYCNSFVSLPRYLCGNAVRPRCFHSFQLDKQFNQKARKYIYDDFRRAFEPFDLSFNGTSITFKPSSYSIRSLFPRCYAYGEQNKSVVRTLYNIYSDFKYRYGIDKCSDMARLAIFTNSYFLRYLDIFSSDCFDRNNPRHLNLDNYNYISFDTDDYSISIYNRIYNAFNVSKRFYDICRLMSFSSEYFLRLIVDFYRSNELHRFKSFYDSLNRWHLCTNKDDFSVHYPVNQHIYNLDSYNRYYKDLLYRDSCFLSHFYSVNFDVSHRVKHKALNDENLIFL